MGFALVNPLAAQWEGRGLSCLLMPEGFDALTARQTGNTTDAAPRPGATASGPARRPGGEATAGGERRDRADRPTRPQHSAPPARDDETAARPAPRPKTDAWRPLPPHVWPAPWRQRLEQTRPGLILWTYRNLGPDLCDAQTPGRQERRGFLRRLLQDLGHPAGTHTFWPVCLPPAPDALPAAPVPDSDGYPANADVFWSGARRLKARGVVVLGSAAAQAAGLPGGLRPPQQIFHRGLLVWVLWDVDNLLQFDRRYTSMLAFLRQAFLPVLR